MSRPLSHLAVFGAAGPFAGLVVRELASRGIQVRGLVRDAGRARRAVDNGATDAVPCDLTDPASVVEALSGIRRVFYLAPVFMADEALHGVGFVEAARRAGVERIVFSSVIHPTIADLPNHTEKLPVEAAIIASGMQYTILQPAVFYQNMAASWAAVMRSGVLAEPFSGEVGLARVDFRDVADVAADALVADRLLDGTFELCAAARTSRREIASMASDVVGRTIGAASPDFDDWAQRTRLPFEARRRRLLARMFAYYDTHGLPGNDLILRAILGREPRTLRSFIEDLQAGRITTAV